MGNFSRKPEDRLKDALAKHYVGVRLQQGVPLLDADWNEMDGIRKAAHEALGTRFIGNGVPSGSDGFRVFAIAEDNNIGIRKGDLLVDGRMISCDSDTTYALQPNAKLTDTLTTPADDTSFVAYLDAWEREVDSDEDKELVDDRIGIETCLRAKQEWAVRVAKGSGVTDVPKPLSGHVHYPLALLLRKKNNAKISAEMITDLRRLHLTLSEGTKQPLELFDGSGTLLYGCDHFAQMFGLTASAYQKLLGSDLFFSQSFSNATGKEGALISFVFQSVCTAARTAEAQALLRLINNADGLKLMEKLYGAQDEFEKTVTSLSTKPESVATLNFAKKFRQLLDGDTTAGITGLKDAVFTKKDLEGSIKAQQKINQEIGSRTQILPHGHLALIFMSGPPPGTVIKVGQTYRYEYQVTFEPVGPGAAVEETFEVIASMKPPGWSAKLVNNDTGAIKLKTGDTTALQVDVEIPAVPAVNESTLNLLVRSQNNPTEMTANNTEVSLKIGGGGVQPSAVNVELLLPVMNLATDTLKIGRGGPVGFAGKATNIQLRFSLLQASAIQDEYNVTFKASAPNTLEDIALVTYPLGGAAGQEKKVTFTLSATEAAVNNTTGNLTVRVEKKTDADTYKELVIKYSVNKA